MFEKEILQQITQKQKELSSAIEIPNEEAEFLENVLVNNSFTGVLNIEKLNLTDFFLAYFISHCDQVPFETAREIIYDNRVIFEKSDSDYCVLIFGSMEDIVTSEEYENILDIFSSLNEENVFQKKINSISLSPDTKNSIFQLTTFYCLAHTNVLGMIQLYHDYYEAFFDSICLVFSTISFKETIATYQQKMEELKEMHIKRISQKNSDRLVEDQLKADFDMSEYQKMVDEIKTYAQEKISNEKNRQKNLRKELNNYLFLEEWIKDNENNADNKILSIPPALLKITDSNLKMKILKDIYQHNYKICIETEKIYENLSSNTLNHYKKVLKKYNIFVPDEELDFSICSEEVDSILNQLKKFNIINPDDMLTILKTTNTNRVEELKEYINNGCLKASFLQNYKEVFNINDDNVLYKNLKDNIAFLKSESIPSSRIKKMDSILLQNPEQIKNNIIILKEYQLIPSIKNTSSYNFLISDNLEEKIDIMIELGYENPLEEDLALLDYSTEDYKRILILKRLNILLDTAEDMKSVLDNKKFIIADSLLDDYLLDMTNYMEFDGNDITKEEFLEKLDNYTSITSRKYALNHLLISKNKVKRELNQLDKDVLSISDQVQCLIKNKILDQSEYQIIKDVLSPSQEFVGMKKVK